jgi:dolichol kinase
MKQEILRKFIHLSSILYPFLYTFLEKREMLIITFILAIFLLLIDIIRIKSSLVRNFLNKFFAKISRESEIDGKFYGSTYFMIGTFFTILLFEKQIAIFSLLILIISDTCASLCGKAIRSRKIYQDKSLAGFLAFVFSASVISVFINPWFIIAGFLTGIAELYAKKIKIDDNLLIPVFYGFLSTIINYITI